MGKKLAPRSTLGKYRIQALIAEGGFARVYRALDVIEDLRVALKVFDEALLRSTLASFRQEVRLAAHLDHPNILPVKNADSINGYFVIAFPLAEKTLSDRLYEGRVNLKTCLDYIEQILEGTAYAHRRNIIHCDIKPQNILLFPDGLLRISDFGIARLALHTVTASGSGTLGYIAPEQAMGKPSPRSDVFSLGLLFYRMLTGYLPEWPFEAPHPGQEILKRKLHRDMYQFILKAIQANPRSRYANAERMLRVFQGLKRKTLDASRGRKKKKDSGPSWNEIRFKQFLRLYGRALETRHECGACGGPVSEAMLSCPWCGKEHVKFKGETRQARRCPRCKRGLKQDWRFCPYCYGPAIGAKTERELSDVRYEGRCSNPGCSRKVLMPFMRYCPWCRRKVRKRWPIADSRERCPSCQWGTLPDFWEHCPWCGKGL